MLKAFVEKICQLQENKTYTINGKTYSDKELILVDEKDYFPEPIRLHGLAGVCDIIKEELEKVKKPLFVEVSDYNKVNVFGTYDEKFRRQELYNVVADLPERTRGYQEYNEAIVALRSQYIQNEGTEYVLTLLGKITNENSVTNEDNGLAQTVEVKQGIALKAKEHIKPIVKLQPYRTFHEVDQPESDFLLRLDDRGCVGVFEADGGAWKLQAKKNIAAYLEEQLECEIKADEVVVIV
ncbi:MAG: hypothetical protein ACK5MV_13765 [Aminipila sp.]